MVLRCCHTHGLYQSHDRLKSSRWQRLTGSETHQRVSVRRWNEDRPAAGTALRFAIEPFDRADNCREAARTCWRNFAAGGRRRGLLSGGGSA
jgi:hypothetical protein